MIKIMYMLKPTLEEKLNFTLRHEHGVEIILPSPIIHCVYLVYLILFSRQLLNQKRFSILELTCGEKGLLSINGR